MRKPYTFLNKVCNRTGHININNNSNNNNNNNDNNNIDNNTNNNIYLYKQKLKERRERERKKIIDTYLRHKEIHWRTQDCLIQIKCFQS